MHFFFFFYRYFIDRNTSIRNLLINKSEKNAHKNNTIDGSQSFLLSFIYFANKPQIFNLQHKHNWYFQHVQVRKMFYSFVYLFWYLCKKKKVRPICANLVAKCNVRGKLETYLFFHFAFTDHLSMSCSSSTWKNLNPVSWIQWA